AVAANAPRRARREMLEELSSVMVSVSPVACLFPRDVTRLSAIHPQMLRNVLHIRNREPSHGSLLFCRARTFRRNLANRGVGPYFFGKPMQACTTSADATTR
ncbi:MAG TPA: hypothetical protein VIN17_17300, partial [Paracoccaceae bacterium]